MQPTSFRGHDIIAPLISLIQAADPDVDVIDGPPPFTLTTEGVVLVGWNEFSPQHITATSTGQDLDERAIETGEVSCYIAVRSGDLTLAEPRARAVEIFANIEAALRADKPVLDGSVDEARITDKVLTQYQTNEGPSVGLAFTVEWVAYI